MGHSVEAMSALTEICRLARGRYRETLHTRQYKLLGKSAVEGGRLGLSISSALLPHRYHGKGWANSCPIKPEAHTKQAEERGRWRTEHQEASGSGSKRPEDMVAMRLVSRVRGCFQDQHVFRKLSVHPGKKTG